MNCQDVRKVYRKLGRHFAGYSLIVGYYSSFVDIAVDISDSNFDNLEPHFLGSLFVVDRNFANCNMTGSLQAS